MNQLSAELQNLYQELILEHNKNPRNFKVLEDATIKQEGYNPVCGDHFYIYLKLDPSHTIIEELCFDGQGCAISKASASMMTTALKGKTIDQANKIFNEFHNLLCHKLDPEKDHHDLGKLEIFSGIWKYPARVKCASLAWHTVKAGLDGNKDVIKTEES